MSNGHRWIFFEVYNPFKTCKHFLHFQYKTSMWLQTLDKVKLISVWDIFMWDFLFLFHVCTHLRHLLIPSSLIQSVFDLFHPRFSFSPPDKHLHLQRKPFFVSIFSSEWRKRITHQLMGFPQVLHAFKVWLKRGKIKQSNRRLINSSLMIIKDEKWRSTNFRWIRWWNERQFLTPLIISSWKWKHECSWSDCKYRNVTGKPISHKKKCEWDGK